MEESEKMVALKKAYADIILNTAKEAAARIVASESKTLRFERDLASTRDDAVRMLLLLKQTIYSKTKDAEVTSLTQKRKIDELEGQLYEAEDVITDLRAELKWVRDKVEKVKKNQLQPLNGQIMKDGAGSQKNMTVEAIIPSILSSGFESVTSSDIDDTPSNQRILDNRCCSITQQTENLSFSHEENPDLAAMVIRSKKPDLYRNESTQRIHALESNLRDEKLPPLGDIESPCFIVNELTKMSNEDARECTVPSPKTKSKNAFAEEMKKPVNFRSSRKRKSWFGKSKAALCSAHSVQPIKPHQLSSVLSCGKIYSGDKNVGSEVTACMPSSLKAGIVNAKKFSSLDEKLQRKNNFNEDGNMMTVSSDVGAPTLISPPDQIIRPCPLSSNFNSQMVYSFAIRGSFKPVEDRSKTAENEAKMKPLPRLDPGLTLIRRGVGPVSGSGNITVSVKALNKCRLFSYAANKVTELKDESALGKPEGDAEENSTGVCSQLSSQIDDVPPVHSDSQHVNLCVETNESPSKLDCNRVLKYTFERKRKKGSLTNSDENTSPDNSTIKRRAAKKQNDAAKPQKSSLINESSRDSRRLVQVARQLVSLSGKRW